LSILFFLILLLFYPTNCLSSQVKEYVIFDNRTDRSEDIVYISFLGDYELTKDRYNAMDNQSKRDMKLLLNYLNKYGLIVINFEFQIPKSDIFAVKLLSNSGVDAAIIANNHSCDYGKTYLFENEKRLFNYGIQPIGVKKYPYWRLTTRGNIYTIYGLTETLDVYCNEVNMTRDKNLGETLANLAHDSDVLIVFAHDPGPSVYITDYEEEKAKYFFTLGADLVIMTGPHTIKGARRYNGKLAIFSLGNFLLSYRGIDEFISIAAIVGFEKDQIVYFSIIPFYDQCGKVFRLLKDYEFNDAVKKYIDRSTASYRMAYKNSLTKKLIFESLSGFIRGKNLDRIRAKHVIIFIKFIYYNYFWYSILAIIFITSILAIILFKLFHPKKN